MSVRGRSIQSRLAIELRFLQGAHESLKGLMKVQQDLTRRAIEDADQAKMTRNRAITRCEQYSELTKELGQYFKEPNRKLTRDSNLFRLLQELAPAHIPPTPPELLNSILSIVTGTKSDEGAWMDSDAAMAEALNADARRARSCGP